MQVVRYLLVAVAIFGLAASLGYIVFQPDPHVREHDEALLVEAEFDTEPRPAPPFSLELLDGTTVSSEALAGDIFILDFWATWCAPCITEIPHYNDLHEAYGDDGVHLIGITVQSGSKEDVIDFAKDDKTHDPIGYPLAMATDDVLDDYGPIWGFPTTLLIDSEMRIVKSWIGATPRKTGQLRYLIAELRGEH